MRSEPCLERGIAAEAFRLKCRPEHGERHGPEARQHETFWRDVLEEVARVFDAELSDESREVPGRDERVTACVGEHATIEDVFPDREQRAPVPLLERATD